MKELDAKIIGRCYPQVSGSNSEPLFDENGKYVEDEKFLTIPAEGYSVKITKSVKLTDFLSSFMVHHSPIFSERLINLMGQFSVPLFTVKRLELVPVTALIPEMQIK